MKKFIILLLLFNTHINLLSQHTIEGTILNQELEPLTSATVILLSQIDSTMVSFTLANNEGKFQLEDVSPDEYLIQVSFVSFANFSQKLEIDWKESSIQLEPIVLDEATELLKEITIKAEHIPMGINGDTISYNASAFKTRPNATVEDLLKKLPGIEVEKNGNIKAQGKDVQNVLVDGKEFFGSDASIATKNLEAEAIDKVKVYDKKSELAEFTGVNDGIEEKTINLELKEEYKQGGFGNINLAGSLYNIDKSKLYDSKANYFRFNPKMQTAIIFSANNINKETFSVNDKIEFLGGFGNAISSGLLNFSEYTGLGKGINESMSTGINFSYDLSEKIKVRTHYILNRNLTNLNEYSKSISFTNKFDYSNQDSIRANKELYKHQLNTKVHYDVNPKNSLIVRNNFSWSTNFNIDSRLSFYQKNLENQGSTRSINAINSESYLYETNVNLKKKYDKAGRNSVVKAAFKIQNIGSYETIDNITQLINNFQQLNQTQNYNNRLNQINLELSHTEALSKKNYFTSEYKFGYNHESPNRKYYDIEGNDRVLNNILTTNYNKVYQFQQAGIKLRRNSKRIKMKLGLVGQLTSLNGSINLGEVEIKNSYKNILPFFDIDYKMNNSKSFTFAYQTNLDAPSLEQLLPIQNNTNANYIYLGNPSLAPTYNHNLSAQFNFFDQFNFTSLFTNINFTISENKIVQKSTIDDNLFQTFQSINTKRYWHTTAYLQFSRPVKAIKSKYKIRTNFKLANYDSYINELASNVTDNNVNFKFSIENLNTDIILIESGFSLDYNTRKYNINPRFDQNFFNTQYFTSIECYLPLNLVASTNIRYFQFSNESFSGASNYLLWSGSISKFLKDEKIEVSLTVNDILNQNTDFVRFGSPNSLNESKYNNLKRYFLLGFNYRIGKAKPKSGIQIDHG